MRSHWIPVSFTLAIMIVLAPGAAAHGYSAAGTATRDNQVYRFFLSRAADLPNGTAPYGITITDAQLNVVESRLFWALDNFVGDEEIPGPTYTNLDFAAESATPGVDFELHGAQVNLVVEAQGHYGAYDVVLASLL
jgi:hypothetical protein